MAGYGVDVMLVKRVVTVGRSHHLFVLDAVVTGVALELGHFTVVVRIVLQRYSQTWRTGWMTAIKHGARVGRDRAKRSHDDAVHGQLV